MATITQALMNLLTNGQTRYSDGIGTMCLMVVAADGSPVGRLPLASLFESNWWNIQKHVEGFIRVAGSSDPALSYKHYAHKDVLNPLGSPFDVFYPCLVGNNNTGSVGEILHVLKKLGATTLDYGTAVWEGEDGVMYRIDGSQGEVMVTNVRPYWQIAGHYTFVDLDNLTLDVFLRSLAPFDFHGIIAEKIDPFGWSPDYCVAHNDGDKYRMHSVYNPAWGGSYSAPYGVTGKFVYSQNGSSVGETYSASATMMGGSGGLHTTDLALYTGEQYAMNLNTDTTKTYPYMNATARGAELLWAGLASEGGTFDSHNAALFGSGFSANDAADASSYEASGTAATNGLRVQDKSSAWKYYSFASNVNFLTGASSGTNMGCYIFNQYRNPWHCMEAYRVICHAIRNHIPALTWFAFEGNKYKWRSVNGYKGPLDGEATCVVFKMFATKAGSSAKDPTDGTTSISGKRVEGIVSTGLWHGITTQASPSWWTSGLVFTQSSSGFECYMQRDQTLLAITPNGEKDTDETWSFESAYEHVGETITTGNGYRSNYHNDCLCLPDTNAHKANGGLHTHVGCYNYFTATAPAAGKKAVRGFRRGYNASGTYLSSLCVFAYYAPSRSYSYIGFGTCCRIVES